MPAAYNSKTINDIEMKSGKIVEKHMTSSSRHNSIWFVKILSFYKILLIKSIKV